MLTFILVFLALAVHKVQASCSFRVFDQDKRPHMVDEPQHLISDLVMCTQWNGKMGCCDTNNDAQQIVSYQQLDGVFGTLAGGCDICAINLKRLWCEYSCSPRQADFVKVLDDNYIVPDPQNPERQVSVQRVKLTVEAQTACELYNSCKRISFVSSVSAMQSPAGFLTFQGHNAVDDGIQYIQVDFSFKKQNSLYFSDDEQQFEMQGLTKCNYTTEQETFHSFAINGTCSCNTCQDSCSDNGDFIYTQSQVFEGFNTMFVGVTWGVVIGLSLIAHFIKKRTQRIKNE